MKNYSHRKRSVKIGREIANKAATFINNYWDVGAAALGGYLLSEGLLPGGEPSDLITGLGVYAASILYPIKKIGQTEGKEKDMYKMRCGRNAMASLGVFFLDRNCPIIGSVGWGFAAIDDFIRTNMKQDILEQKVKTAKIN